MFPSPPVCMNRTSTCLHSDSQNSLIRVCCLAVYIPTSPPKGSQEVPLSFSCRYWYSGMIGLNPKAEFLSIVSAGPEPSLSLLRE